MRLALALAVASACWPHAGAHDFWIEPSSFTPEPGSLLQIRLRVGEHLKGEPVPRNPSRIERFFVVGPGGEAPVEGFEGEEPAGVVRVSGPGIILIGYRSRPSYLELEPVAFEKYLIDEGLQRVIAARLQRNESEKGGRERYSRYAKSLVAAGGGVSAGHDRRLGFPLELIPEANPFLLREGGELPLRLVYRDQPLAGALVVALGAREPDKRVAARTDAGGRVVLKLLHPGAWLVKSVHMIEATDGGADWESLWASLTFEVPGAEPVASP